MNKAELQAKIAEGVTNYPGFVGGHPVAGAGIEGIATRVAGATYGNNAELGMENTPTPGLGA